LRLFLTAASLLFVELLLIRWSPANVIYVGFSATSVLVVVGVLYAPRGCWRRGSDSWPMWPL